jgi:hypothetical protein
VLSPELVIPLQQFLGALAEDAELLAGVLQASHAWQWHHSPVTHAAKDEGSQPSSFTSNKSLFQQICRVTMLWTRVQADSATDGCFRQAEAPGVAPETAFDLLSWLQVSRGW